VRPIDQSLELQRACHRQNGTQMTVWARESVSLTASSIPTSFLPRSVRRICATFSGPKWVRFPKVGKIRYAGCSNTAAWQLMQSLWTASERGTVRFDAIQPRYNLIHRRIETELLPAAAANGVAVVVYNPLAGGVLTGKYKAGEAPREGTRFMLGQAATLYQTRYWQNEQLDVVARLAADVAARGKSITHVALRWVLDQPGVTNAIVGASRAEQLRDSLKAVDVVLDDADRHACDAAWYALPRCRPEDER
jgi:aryl-alcohol dehydrogenase-like predicted oxidoreductase